VSKKETHNANNFLNEDASSYGFVHKSETEKLKEDISLRQTKTSAICKNDKAQRTAEESSYHTQAINP